MDHLTKLQYLLNIVLYNYKTINSCLNESRKYPLPGALNKNHNRDFALNALSDIERGYIDNEKELKEIISDINLSNIDISKYIKNVKEIINNEKV